MSENKKELASSLKRATIERAGEGSIKAIGYRDIKSSFYDSVYYSENYRTNILSQLKCYLSRTKAILFIFAFMLFSYFVSMGSMLELYRDKKPEDFIAGTMYLFVTDWFLPAIIDCFIVYVICFFIFVYSRRNRKLARLRKFKDYRNSLFFKEYSQKIRSNKVGSLSSKKILEDMSLDAYSFLFTVEEKGRIRYE